MFSLRQHLPSLTAFGLICGLFLGFGIGRKEFSSEDLKEDGFIREVERGARMRVVITSPQLHEYVTNRAELARKISSIEAISLTQNIGVVIPDSDAESFTDCRKEGQDFFAGEVGNKVEAYLPAPHDPTSAPDHHVGAFFQALGTLYTCERDPNSSIIRKSVVARGIHVVATTHSDGTTSNSYKKTTAVVSYADFLANLFVTFLLMLFVPTLALSLVRSVIDSSGHAQRFRFASVFFVVSSLAAAIIGAGCGLGLATLRSDLDHEHLRDLSQAFAGRLDRVTYDPHPLMTQLSRIIPTNPLGALTDPNENSGLQVAFIALLVGVVLASLSAARRAKISQSLKQVLAVVVKDQELGWKAFSDFAELLTPVGVFFVAVSTAAKVQYQDFQDLAWLIGCILIGLLLHVLILTVWLRLRRNWRAWSRDGFVPALPGLLTAFATSSSYSALPAVGAVPLVSRDSLKRGILDFGFTLNKCGTALYISASAAFFLAHFGDPSAMLVLLIIGLATLAGTATAGLPFAAAFGLRMVLVAAHLPGGLAWLILPIDSIVDRFVTAVNVFCNLAACSDPRRIRIEQHRLRHTTVIMPETAPAKPVS